MSTRVADGESGSAGDRVNPRHERALDPPLAATVLPSAATVPPVTFRSSKAAPTDAKYAVSPRGAGSEAAGIVEADLFLVEAGTGLGPVIA